MSGGGAAQGRIAGGIDQDGQRRHGQDEADTGLTGFQQRLQQPRRARQHDVAQRAAEAGGQRPCRRRLQRAEGGGGNQYAGDPCRHARLAHPARLAAYHADCPQHRQRQQHDDAEPEHLDEKIRQRSAEEPEPVVHRAVGGIAEAGVVDRPCGKGRDRGAHAGQNGKAAQQREIAVQKVDDPARLVARCGKAGGAVFRRKGDGFRHGRVTLRQTNVSASRVRAAAVASGPSTRARRR